MESDLQLRSAGLHLKNHLRPRKVFEVMAKVVKKAVAQKSARKSQKNTAKTGDASSASPAAVTGAPTTSAVLPVASRLPTENEQPPTLAPPVTPTSTPTPSTSSHQL
ncbi:hypothetical protein TYRP_021141 [Tyrophagus putrescentiae]|nr:hypothetical protein TYRP_021141 [Tyrophagus putrescentiae]